MKIRRTTDTGEWTTRRYLSLLGSVLIWVIVAIDAWYLWPAQLGGSTSMVIVSGVSMEPSYFDGDLVIARKITPTVGDVIVYAPEGLGGAQVVHRIIGGSATEGWQLQGDNNDFIDPYLPKGDEVKGVVLVHYSNFGRVTVLLLNPIVWAFVLLAAIVLMVWYGGDTCEDDPDDDSDDDASASNAGSPDEAQPPADDVVDDPVRDEVAVGAVESSPPRGFVSTATARLGAAVGAVALAFGISVTPASASQLSVNAGGSIAALSYSHCAAQTLSSTMAGSPNGQNYPQVAVSGVAASCAGLPMVVYLHRANGSVIASASGTATAGTTTLPTAGSYNIGQVATVVVAIDGWLYLSTWTTAAASCIGVNAAGVPTGDSCTLTNSSGSSWGGSGNRQGNYYFNGITAAPYVLLTVNFQAATGLAPYVVNPVDPNPANVLAPGYTCSSLPILRVVRANQNYNNGSTFWGGFTIFENPAAENGTSVCP